jgi:hypothetical protein
MKTVLVVTLCLLGTAAQAQVYFGDDGSPFDPNQQRVFEQQRQGLYNMQQQQRQFQLDAQQQQEDQYQRLQQQRPVRCFNSFGQLVCR